MPYSLISLSNVPDVEMIKKTHFMRHHQTHYMHKDITSFLKHYPELTLDQQYNACMIGHKGVVAHEDFKAIFAQCCKEYIEAKNP